ncbi:hypothetical protein ACFQ45_08925 [Rhodanobacter aciditrophus]|uniref:Uncharacterized protein n=1 Tax=Rhodanobacter aciditrophus TaxID=1623218 RepID=A0ABW4B0L4_9GAMM
MQASTINDSPIAGQKLTVDGQDDSQVLVIMTMDGGAKLQGSRCDEW